MIIIRMAGGLGNQMFQYAFARELQEQCGEEIKINNVVNINTHLYDKTIIEETGEIFYLEEYDDYYLAICKYSSSTRTFYSNQIKITKEIKQEEHIEENKTNVPLIVIISVSSVSLLGLAIFFIIKFIKK